MNDPTQPPDAELLLATDCSHCPAVLNALTELVKQGLVGRLEVINVGIHPGQARLRNARSVPWTRIGPFILPGSYTREELDTWARRAREPDGMADYFAELLENQRLDEALALVRRDRGQLPRLVDMVGDLETPMGVRIGIGAMFEELAASGELDDAVELLGALTHTTAPQVRADAAYYLGLVGPVARDWLIPLLMDPDQEVREIAKEGLEGLGD